MVVATPIVKSTTPFRRPPLLQSEKDNNNNNNKNHNNNNNNNGGVISNGGGGGGGQYRRPKSREVSSRYLSISSSSSTSNSSTSSSTNNLLNQSASFRRCPSPSPVKAVVAVGETPVGKRAVSAERRRPATLKGRIPGEMSAAAKMLVSSTRSLSVSFQGESYAVPRVKSVKPVVNSGSGLVSGSVTPGLRKGTPERRRNAVTPWKSGENARPSDQPWPSRVVSMSRSVDLGSGKVVRGLRDSLVSGDRNLGRTPSCDSATLRKSMGKDDGNVASMGLESRILDRNSSARSSDDGNGNVVRVGLESRILDRNSSARSSEDGNVVRMGLESRILDRNSSARSSDSGSLRKSGIKDGGNGNAASVGLDSRVLDRNSSARRNGIKDGGNAANLNATSSDSGKFRKNGTKDEGNLGLESRILDGNSNATSSDSAKFQKNGIEDGDLNAPSSDSATLRKNGIMDGNSNATSSDSATLGKSGIKDEGNVDKVGLESRVSDADSVSSGHNSVSSMNSDGVSRSSSGKGGGRSLIVAPRYWQDSKRSLDPSSPMARMTAASKKFVGEAPVASPRRPLSSSGNRGLSSPIRGNARPASPSNMSFERCKPSSPIRGNVRPASPIRGNVRPASPIRGNVRPASPIRGNVRPASPIRGNVRPASPSKMSLDRYRPPSPSPAASDRNSPSNVIGRGPSPLRARMGSPLRARGSVGSTPSVLSYGVDVRATKVGGNRLGDAHLLRILYNRHLQWRFVNAKAESSLSIQHFSAERSLYNAWTATSDLFRTVSSKRQELQWLRLKLKLVSILKLQILHLEEWTIIDKDHCTSLSGATESLKGSTIRLPLIAGARVDVQDLKDAICSAADVMHSMASSICALSRKVEEINSLAAEVASLTAKERYFLNECKDTLSMLTAMQVKDCSLRAHILQLKRALSSLADEV